MASMSAFLAEEAGQFVTLGIDGEIFAVGVDAVREILDMQPMARVPNAPPFLLGIIDVRGRSVPVLDLRVKLGLPPIPPSASTRIVELDTVIDGRPLVWGVVADQVFDVTPLDDHRLEPPPEIGIRWRSDYIRGVGRRNGGFVIIFDLARLFAADETTFLAGEASS